ncbi:MAG: hypothetical protein RBR35_09280 [Salinivirgaceae bacterium]|nr:hypothetical protein [Salinivirgaceae bacterium]MDY0280738.1 hypothetical protein [Salinivirgaceae bacterium]
MVTKYKLDKVFGPIGASSGYLMFVVGLIVIWFSLGGIVLGLFGAFIGFTQDCTYVDFHVKRIKSTTNIFGIIPIGKWHEIKKEMRLGVKKNSRTWRRNNQNSKMLNVSKKDYRIVLCYPNGDVVAVIRKTDTLEAAKIVTNNLHDQLGLDFLRGVADCDYVNLHRPDVSQPNIS